MTKYNPEFDGKKTVFLGIDLHRKSWYLTAILEEQVVFHGNMPPDKNVLLNFLSKYFKSYKIEAVYEAGYFGFRLCEFLNENGIKCLITPPTLVPMEYGNRVKTDKRDSRKLAYLLSKGMLKKIWVPNSKLCAHRQILRRRQQLVSDRRRVQQRIKGMLSFYGIPFPYHRGEWSQKFINQLKEIDFGDLSLNESYYSLFDQLEYLHKAIQDQEKLLKELSKTKDYADKAELLQSVPGVGAVSTMFLLLELGDISRFNKSDKLAAYVGLTPSQFSSGDKIRMGRITKSGKRNLRAVMIQVAWNAIRKDPEIKAIFNNLMPRCGKKKAAVAIARKLLIRCRRVLLDNVPYQEHLAA